jgi:hypothetical protein
MSDSKTAPIANIMQAVSAEKLKRSWQLVVAHNTDELQTHFMSDRFSNHVSLQPGERKELAMTVDEIASHRLLCKPNRGFYASGPKVGQPLPAHPVKLIDIPGADVVKQDSVAG